MLIIHVDMDAFYAAVEARDNPALAGLPLIIGALPGERGVVSTCSYEARAFGVRSAMSIFEAQRRCPDGIFMYPDMKKYQKASRIVQNIWNSYTDICECVSLDEGFLDVTHSAHLFGGAAAIGREIKARTMAEAGLTCSVGIGYSMMSAKLASEENKPDGFFEIPDAAALIGLIAGRGPRVIYGVGEKTAAQLARVGITTVRQIIDNPAGVEAVLGNHGRQIIDLARGIDPRRPVCVASAKSIGNEHTFAQDIADFDYLRDVLRLLAESLSYDIRTKGIFASTIGIKITYGGMRQITRAKTIAPTDRAVEIYKTAESLIDKIDRSPVRLLGLTLSGLTQDSAKQTSIFDEPDNRQERLEDTLLQIQQKHGRQSIKTASILQAEKNTVNT
ncbi:MAG: DNA polymerase IV [Defluviitaleaceae bacterium]|nr:DNA polymerase IV [Defluviitaleaceae bacterium]